MGTQRENVCMARMKQEIDRLTVDTSYRVPAGPLSGYNFRYVETGLVAKGTAAGLIAYDHYKECLAQPSVPNVKPPRQR